MAPPSTPDKLPPIDSLGQPITVKVGQDPDAKELVVDKGLLCFYSGYFEAAAKKDTFIEGEKGVIELPTEGVKAFTQLVGWLYTRKIALPECDSKGTCYATLLNLYLFADRRHIPLLKNQVLDLLRNHMVMHWISPTANVEEVHENTTVQSPLRKFLAGFIGETTRSDALDFQYEFERLTICPEAVWDALKVVWKLKERGSKHTTGKEAVGKWDMCEYHDHEEGVKCPK